MKHARDMTEAERAAAIAEIKRGPPPEPMPPSEKKARDMTEAERSEWWSEYRRRYR
jgi:hypothetical protein